MTGDYQGLTGLVLLVALAWLLSENRRQVQWRSVVAGLALQILLAFLLLKLPASRGVFVLLNNAVMALEEKCY